MANSCTIKRTFVRNHGTFSLATGKIEMTRSETVTEQCNVPLFGDTDRQRGICSACAEGWEVPDNTFADDAERSRAKGA